MSTIKADGVEAATGTNTDLTLAGKGTGVPDLAAGFKVGSVAGVPTASIRDDAVTLAKLAAGTDGELITWDASGDPAAVAVGTATHVLTSNGAGAAPTFQAAGGGAWTFLGAGSASSAASIDFTSLVTATYDSYVIVFSDFEPATSTADLVLLTSVDNGSSWLASGYLYHAQKVSDDSTSYAAETGNTSSWLILDNQSDWAPFNSAGFIYIHSPTNASKYTRINTLANGGENAGASVIGGSTIGGKNPAADNDALQLKYTSGNIETGEARLYGIANS